MHREVLSCSKDDTLEQATRIMWDADVGSLVVLDGAQRPAGLITDRDIAMAAYTQGVALRDTRVASAMSKELHTCGPDASLSEVESLMQKAQIRRVPVVGQNGELLGIIGLGDLARSASSSPLRVPAIPGVAKTLAAVTERRANGAATAE
jgi:CBS-domain-containing membrane protein